MRICQSLIAQACLALVALIYSAVVRSSLPATVPVHWNAAGKADAFGSPGTNLWMMPVMMAFMMLLTWGLPKISPKQFGILQFERTYGLIMVLVAALLMAIHVIIVSAMRGSHFDMTGVMMGVMGAFFAVLGLFLGNVKRNFFMGIRTPWTIASEQVWEATHRQAGPLWFYGGLAIAIMALLGVPMGVLLVVLMAIALWPVLNSFLLYKRLEA